jgi:hypothetical protein
MPEKYGVSLISSSWAVTAREKTKIRKKRIIDLVFIIVSCFNEY